jgi:hypothetical protein
MLFLKIDSMCGAKKTKLQITCTFNYLGGKKRRKKEEVRTGQHWSISTLKKFSESDNLYSLKSLQKRCQAFRC